MKILVFLTWLIVVTLLVVGVTEVVECGYDAHGCDEVCQTAIGMQTLQPAMGNDRAEELASHFVDAGDSTKIDPLLLVAISFRESSLSRRVESREVKGSLGEVGLMQTHGVSLRYRPEECSQELRTARCQILTGANYLALIRDICGGSTWRWVASYGMSNCASEGQARQDRAAKVAYRYYLKIGGSQWE